MTNMRLSSFRIPLFLLVSTLFTAKAFSASLVHPSSVPTLVTKKLSRQSDFSSVHRRIGTTQAYLINVRGGGQEESSGDTNNPRDLLKRSCLLPALSIMSQWGKTYSSLLETRPIVTKSVTAGIIFGLSDWTAQILQSSGKAGDDDKEAKKSKLDKPRLIGSILVGLLYFGPAAHAWYDWIFKLLPETTLISTCYKAVLGQLIFGPCFTCIFFATSLIQSGDFTLKNWWTKVRKDLFGVWAAGLGYWPVIDFISYAWIPVIWIPLFVNFCSFVWTIYLSLVANSRARTSSF